MTRVVLNVPGFRPGMLFAPVSPEIADQHAGWSDPLHVRVVRAEHGLVDIQFKRPDAAPQ